LAVRATHGCRQRPISGPPLDGINIHLDVPRIHHEQLVERHPGEPLSAVQERVEWARQVQAHRLEGTLLLD
jgi:magnesium chelatase family protein